MVMTGKRCHRYWNFFITSVMLAKVLQNTVNIAADQLVFTVSTKTASE